MQHARLAKLVDEHCFLVKRFFERCGDELAVASRKLTTALRSGNKVLIFGNGGSAADAQHIAAELIGRFQTERPGLAAIALTTDTSTLTSVANDYGFDYVFARQIESLAQSGDIVIAMTTSGHSKNVLEGLRAAREKGAFSIALLGRDGGPARELADLPLIVTAEKTARIQEVHHLIGHVLCESIEEELFGS